NAQHEGTEHLVPDVEVVVRVAGPPPRHDPVVRVVGGVLRQSHGKLRALFQAFEDEVRAESLAPLHAGAVRTDVVFSLEAFRLEGLVVGPFDRDAVVARKRFDPLLILLGAFGQRLFGDRVDLVHVAEEMDDVLGSGQQGQIALDDDAIETVIYKGEQAAKQLAKGFHRSSPLMLASATRSCVRRLVETISFDHPYPDSDRNVRSTRSFITKGSALEIRDSTVPGTAGDLRDFKGRA